MSPGHGVPGLREERAVLSPAGLVDKDMFDVVTLTRRDSCIAGNIVVSTAMVGHEPRVRGFPERPSCDGPGLIVTLGADPSIMVQDVPTAKAGRAASALRARVQGHEPALLLFWREGRTSTRDEVNAFFDTLTKIDAA